MKKILIFILLMGFFCTAYAKSPLHYTIVIDAGSSGSRLYIYKYQAIEGELPATIEELGSKKVSLGISNYANHPEDVIAYFEPLLTYAKNKIDPLVSEKEVDFYLLATAGMRLLSHDQQLAIYKNLSKYISQHSQFQIKDIKTITGSWEGIYDWIAANYLNQTLIPNKTFGILDMGGASAEITFEAEDAKQADIKKIIVGDNRYSVYSYSYLGLGQNVARNQYMNNADCFPVDYSLPSGKKGAGDFSQCKFHIWPLLNLVHRVKHNTPNIPNYMKFIAFAGYFDTADSKEFNLGSIFSSQQLSQKANVICSQQWSELKEKYPDDNYLYSYCFNAALQSALLTDGYGFDENYNFRTTDKIAGKSLDWPLGVVLYNIGK